MIAPAGQSPISLMAPHEQGVLGRVRPGDEDRLDLLDHAVADARRIEDLILLLVVNHRRFVRGDATKAILLLWPGRVAKLTRVHQRCMSGNTSSDGQLILMPMSADAPIAEWAAAHSSGSRHHPGRTDRCRETQVPSAVPRPACAHSSPAPSRRSRAPARATPADPPAPAPATPPPRQARQPTSASSRAPRGYTRPLSLSPISGMRPRASASTDITRHAAMRRVRHSFPNVIWPPDGEIGQQRQFQH